MKKPTDLITLTQAKAILGVSNDTMSRMVHDGTIKIFPNPLDLRQKLVSKSAIEKLKPRLADLAVSFPSPGGRYDENYRRG